MERTEGTVLVTGGAGFIGSNLVTHLVSSGNSRVINLDKLTYAGNLRNLASILNHEHHEFVVGDIGNPVLVREILTGHQPRAIINLAAESHVDRSIVSPSSFIETNVLGTFNLLEEARKYWSNLEGRDKELFRFLHVSTDEVYGSLAPEAPPFSESTPYSPNSPYAASKAGADHLVRAYYHTYRLPTLTTNCSNNYGPYQFPEKFIPLMIVNAISGEPLPVYGDGANRRDWLYVEDHCRAIMQVLARGRVGETYNVGGDSERANMEVVYAICDLLDELRPLGGDASYRAQIAHVPDRPGHDRRYAIDARKLRSELCWRPEVDFETGLRRTVQWYLDHPQWVREIQTQEYRQWISTNYGSRYL